METITKINPNDWKNLVAKYQTSHTWKSIWQLGNSLIPFFVLWYAMYRTLEVSYWLTLLLSIPAAGFQVRIFIIQHDCGHGSFLKSHKANSWIGLLCSFITWTPYFYWRKGHGIHHAHAGNLEYRGIGDVYTMTVQEYLQKSTWGKIKYRLYRHPLFLFFFIPAIIFVLWYRFPTSKNKALKKVQSNVYWTDLVIILLVGSLIWLVGLKAYLLVQLPIIFLAASAGNWLFYVQHQFEDTYWADKNNWDFSLAAMQGSSYYKLPKIIQWFTGNIGFHHIHHLSPVIPNYLLEKCYKNNLVFQKAVTLNLHTSLKSIFLSLWDEDQKKIISFHKLKKIKVHHITATI
ncbi:MAG: fatty acid desaturase [Ignavibacteriales bacterium]|nr:fatty acid desaturase [Ignavibacteriales bacterium]